MPWVFPKICDEQIFTIHAEDVLLVTDVSEKMNIYYWDTIKIYTDNTDSIKNIEEEPEEDYQEEKEIYEKLMSQLGNKRTIH
jgi:hypothetical protein